MGSTKHLIIPILIQDMKHEQLISGLKRLGFHSEMHDLDLAGVVIELMGIPETEMSWEWYEIYMDFLHQAVQHEITADGENLLPLAEICYTLLHKRAEWEKESKRITEHH